MVNHKLPDECGGNDKFDMTPMVEKVIADIAFLEEKLTYMSGQRTPNKAVIKIYKDMLSNREGVRDWLSRNSSKDNKGGSSQTTINH